MVYSKNNDAIRAFRAYAGPSPAPLILNKSEPDESAYQAIVAAMAKVESATATSNPRKLFAHYGAGKIGLGALLPTVSGGYNNSGVVLLNRVDASSEFSKWAYSVRSNGFFAHIGKDRFKLTVWHENDPSCDLAAAVDRCKAQGGILLVLTNNSSVLRRVMSQADFVTMSVGSKSVREVALELANALPDRLKEIHALENDHGMVESVSLLLEAKGIKLYPTVVDRICTVRQIGQIDLKVTVESLPPAMIFFKTPASEGSLSAKTGITLAKSSEEFRFLHGKKRWLMNFLYWSISVTRAARLLSNGREWEQVKKYFINESAGNVAEQELFFTVARLSAAKVASDATPTLLQQMDWASPERLYNNLLDYAERSILRTDQVEDTFGRVLKSDGYFDRYRDFFDTFRLDFNRNRLVRCQLAGIDFNSGEAEKAEGHLRRLDSHANDVRRAL